jgi:hypothetical protein
LQKKECYKFHVQTVDAIQMNVKIAIFLKYAQIVCGKIVVDSSA